MAGVNHGRSYCRLSKTRGMMFGGKYSAVIGLKEPIAWKMIRVLGTYTNTRFSTNHSVVFPPVHPSTEFRQTTVWATVVDPSH